MPELDLGKVLGSQLHNVTAAPSASLGLMNDWALNTTNGDVYEKTTDAAWTKRGNFKGPVGATGAQGNQGVAGKDGAKGADGARGSRWNTGTAITGTSTTAAVFTGSGITDALVDDMYLNTGTGGVYRCTVAGAASAAKWVYAGSIKGAKGDKGEKGDKGDTGAAGVAGAPGGQGPQGKAGADGKTPTFTINAAGHLIATFE